MIRLMRFSIWNYIQDLLEYRRKMRTLKVRMLDGTVKTMLVDDSQPVTNLMVVICTKIGTLHVAAKGGKMSKAPVLHIVNSGGVVSLSLIFFFFFSVCRDHQSRRVLAGA